MMIYSKNIQQIICLFQKSRTFAPVKHRGVEQLVARWAHNPKVIRSSRISATKDKKNRRNAVLLFMTTLLYWFYSQPNFSYQQGYQQSY